ncbi:hypothetical protein DP113_03295 [Brasilonema octagenarum UFV-E1]|uniref:Uncharacterized protein n=2 Tax=Brasilonema TaxID=383614 RepID=A0A856M8M5_9CYAN|nr:hypothetical protein [Brasilonema octagenarum]NMF64703.1 hypothetical protein [Brasilonema octagenarum UFV-OR1]QDL07072.1 hypothetical protein DP114_03340 [Brasilonema sennae CENA114]QDL13436.1 hypothetical protein DP113_03295 [Brasilonema octagenarum UFV-E1]
MKLKKVNQVTDNNLETLPTNRFEDLAATPGKLTPLRFAKKIIKVGSSLLGGDSVATLRVRHFAGKKISPASGLTTAVNPHLYYWGRT